MAVEPAGFNTTMELVSAMTYSKAPEFVGMVAAIIGKVNFVRALANYYSKYAYSNATSDQWVAEMAAFQPDGVDLKKMANGWLKRTGYPTVTVEKRVGGVLSLRQGGFEDKPEGSNDPWIVPVAWSAVKAGKSVASGLWILQEAAQDFTVTGCAEQDFDYVSVGCGWSFYGAVADESQTVPQRHLQAANDPDTVNRYLAFQSVLDAEKARIVQSLRSGAGDGLISVSPSTVALYGVALTDASLDDAAKARFLAVGADAPSRPEIGHLYTHLARARTAVLQAVGDEYEPRLSAEYARLAEDSTLSTRPLKHAVFAALRAARCEPRVLESRFGGEEEKRLEAGRESCRALILPLMESDHMSDRQFALVNLLELGGPTAGAAKDKARAEWCGHSIGTEQYITAVAVADCPETIANIRELVTEPFFKIELAGHSRTVCRAWCGNRRRALLTGDGLELTKFLFSTVGKVNVMSVYGFLGTFGQVGLFEGAVRERLVEALEWMREEVKGEESLNNQLGRLIGGIKE